MARICPQCGRKYLDDLAFCGEDGVPTVAEEEPRPSGEATNKDSGPTRSCPKCKRTYPNHVFFCGQDGTITVQDQGTGDFDNRLGKQLGGYIVVARVADGAMGRVYEGRHPETKARVAIKVLHAETTQDEVAVERFKREYETATELDHPNLIKVLEFGDTPDGSFFMTMEYLEGEELRKVLDRDHALPMERVIRILSQAALALDTAHSYGFIHRDLKPDNIFLCKTEGGDDVRILDFGSVKLQVETGAKLTALGTTLGSPYYMSPEQARGAQDVDQRTDVFALSAILYEMLTGNIAFGGPNVAQILVKIMNETPPPASTLNSAVPQALDDVVEKGLRKDKERRYGTTLQLAEAMVKALGLAGTAEDWSHTSQSDIASALSGATPPAPKPFGVDSMAPPPPSPESPVEITGADAPPVVGGSPVSGGVPYIAEEDRLPARPRRVGMGVVAGIALAVAAAGGLLAYLLF
jgi:serine/threonine-protein kinase